MRGVTDEGVPFVSFDMDELGICPKVSVGDLIDCPHCDKKHELVPPDKPVDSRALYFYRCSERIFVGAVNERLVTHLFPRMQ